MSDILAGKVALVTGGAGDVGRMIVERMVGEGASVLATDFDIAKLDSIWSGNANVATIAHDVTSEAGWSAAVLIPAPMT